MRIDSINHSHIQTLKIMWKTKMTINFRFSGKPDMNNVQGCETESKDFEASPIVKLCVFLLQVLFPFDIPLYQVSVCFISH